MRLGTPLLLWISCGLKKEPVRQGARYGSYTIRFVGFYSTQRTILAAHQY